MKPVFKIGSSEDLNSSQAILLLEVGETHCCFGILDYANQMLVELAYYAADEDGKEDILRKVIETNKELTTAFRQTVICYYMRENIIIPSKFYRYEETKPLLQLLYEKGPNTVVSESVAEWQLYNAYHVPAATHELLGRSFATGNFWHAYSIILKNGIEAHEGGKLVIDFKTDSFSVVAVRNNTLLLSQIFYYARADDVLYWLLKICTQFSLSQDEVTLLLSGLIDKRSVVLKEIFQYFLNVEFATVENDIQLSEDFGQYPVHFFSSLFKLALCVS